MIGDANATPRPLPDRPWVQITEAFTYIVEGSAWCRPELLVEINSEERAKRNIERWGHKDGADHVLDEFSELDRFDNLPDQYRDEENNIKDKENHPEWQKWQKNAAKLSKRIDKYLAWRGISYAEAKEEAELASKSNEYDQLGVILFELGQNDRIKLKGKAVAFSEIISGCDAKEIKRIAYTEIPVDYFLNEASILLSSDGFYPVDLFPTDTDGLLCYCYVEIRKPDVQILKNEFDKLFTPKHGFTKRPRALKYDAEKQLTNNWKKIVLDAQYIEDMNPGKSYVDIAKELIKGHKAAKYDNWETVRHIIAGSHPGMQTRGIKGIVRKD